MPTLYLWDFAINFYFKCSSVCSQKFRGYETHIRSFFFFLPPTLNKNSCMKVPNKMDNVQRKEQGFYDFNTDLTEKKKLKSRVISLWGVSPMSGKRKKICTFNSRRSLQCLWSTLTFWVMVHSFRGRVPSHSYPVEILKREKIFCKFKTTLLYLMLPFCFV